MSASRSRWCSPTAWRSARMRSNGSRSTSSRLLRSPAARRRAQGDRLLFEAQGTNRADAPSRPHAAMPMPLSRRPLCAAREISHPAPLRPDHGAARRSRAMGSGDGRLTVSGAAKVPFFNRRILAKQIGLADDAIEHGRERRRRRLRRPRRILSGGFSDSVRGPAHRPAGEMDRGPPREFDGDEPCPRGRSRCRDRLRA